MSIITNLKLTLLGLLLITIAGCNIPDKKNESLSTVQKLHQIDCIKLIETPDSSYIISSKDSSSISFSKSSKNSSTIISIRVFEERKFGNEDKFIFFAEGFIDNQMKSYEMKSLHYTVLGFKNTICLKFDGTYRDSINQGNTKEYISHEGYICKVPADESKIAEIKVVHYSTDRLMPNEVIYEFQRMVEQLQFIEN